MQYYRRQDTETFPIREGLLAPKLVCVQWAKDTAQHHGPINIDLREGARATLEDDLYDDDVLFEMHNGSFDWAVLCNAYPELTQQVFRMLANQRGRDTLLRQKLQQIAAGTMPENTPKGYWSLAGIAKRTLGVEVDKGEDTYRLKYALLDDVPVAQWPAEAVQYATGDITTLRAVSEYQLRQPYQPPDEWLQVAADFCLQLAAVWGLRVDEWRLGWAQMVMLADDARCVDLLTEAGLFKDGSVNRAAVQAAVERACKAANIPVPRTNPTKTRPEGSVKYDAETTEALAEHDAALTALSQHTTATKMLNVYLEPMQHGVKQAMTSRPNVLVNTGRTSWAGAKHRPTNPWWPDAPDGFQYAKQEIKVGTNLQNWPQMPGIRDCVVSRPGTYLCSVDYNSLELRTLGQACLWLLGRSTFADGYRQDPNWDPHSYFGGQLIGIDYATAMQRVKTDKSFKNGPRKVGKTANFSLPGGAGARRLAGTFDELYKVGELPKPYSVDECRAIREQWLDAYPEMRDYFELANWHSESRVPIKQLVSNRVRAGCTYASAANTWFQGLAADLAKRALFYVTQACYGDPMSPLFGARVVAFIHDELLVEVPIELAHECAMEIERLMVMAAQEVCPDVPFAAEAALMTFWNKAASPKFVDGRLVPDDA